MQLLVLVPAILVLGAPLSVAEVPCFKLALNERPAANSPSEVPHWMLELPTRALAAAGPRILPYVAVLPMLVTLPAGTEDGLKTLRPIRTDSAESAPRSPRAPPTA